MQKHEGKSVAEMSDIPDWVHIGETADGVQVQIPSNLRNYSFFMSDDQVFFKKNKAACELRFDKGTAQHKRFTAFIELTV